MKQNHDTSPGVRAYQLIQAILDKIDAGDDGHAQADLHVHPKIEIDIPSLRWNPKPDDSEVSQIAILAKAAVNAAADQNGAKPSDFTIKVDRSHGAVIGFHLEAPDVSHIRAFASTIAQSALAMMPEIVKHMTSTVSPANARL